MSATRAAARPRLDPASFPSMGPGQLRPGRDGDALDGLLPQAVITAREPAHLLAVIEEARAKRFGIVTSGGGTLLHVGALPRAYDIRLSMTAFGNIGALEPDDMTVTCDAGVSLSRLQRALAKVGQRLAIDAPRDDRASIGGLVASNTSGGLRQAFGLPRDLVLGLAAVDGCGRTIRGGGRVVKNVAGYDLVRLLCGSWGNLAILTELTLRTHPLPRASATLVFEFVSPLELDAARQRLVAEPLPLAALDFALDASEATALWMLAVRIEGSEQEVAFQGDRVCALVGRDPADAAEDWLSPAWVDDDGGVTVKTGAAPSAIVGVVRNVFQALRAAAPAKAPLPLRIGGHLGAGIARFHLAAAADSSGGDGTTAVAAAAPPATLVDALLAATTPDGRIATRVVERATLRTKNAVEVWGPAPPSLPLMRAIKRELDPDDVLSPGRFVGGL